MTLTSGDLILKGRPHHRQANSLSHLQRPELLDPFFLSFILFFFPPFDFASGKTHIEP